MAWWPHELNLLLTFQFWAWCLICTKLGIKRSSILFGVFHVEHMTWPSRARWFNARRDLWSLGAHYSSGPTRPVQHVLRQSCEWFWTVYYFVYVLTNDFPNYVREKKQKMGFQPLSVVANVGSRSPRAASKVGEDRDGHEGWVPTAVGSVGFSQLGDLFFHYFWIITSKKKKNEYIFVHSWKRFDFVLTCRWSQFFASRHPWKPTSPPWQEPWSCWRTCPGRDLDKMSCRKHAESIINLQLNLELNLKVDLW